jgi:hypothetical protein
MDNTLENALQPIYDSIEKANTYSPDNPNSPLPTEYYDNATKSKKQQINFGNGVMLEQTVAAPTFASETIKVGQSVLFDIGDELGSAYQDIDESTNHLLTKTHPLLGMAVYKSLDQFKKIKSKFEPKTETGVLIRDVASEIGIMVVNNALLKKIKLLSGVPKNSQKFVNWTKSIASSSLRWGLAEGGAAAIARNDEKPFVLMISDLTGITDENDLTEIREIFQQGTATNEPWDKIQKRLLFAADGFVTGSAFETIMPILSTVYGMVLASGGAGYISDDLTQSAVQDQQEFKIKKDMQKSDNTDLSQN